MRLVDVARAVRDKDETEVLVASWGLASPTRTGPMAATAPLPRSALSSAVHVHVDRAKYRGLMAPRCAKRAVLFLAARIVERARRTGRAVVAGYGDGGIIAALAAECARTELAFERTELAPAPTKARVKSVSFGTNMRYPVHADVCVVAARDARALYPVNWRKFLFVGDRDAWHYAQMALSVVSHRTNSVSMAQYVDEIEAYAARARETLGKAAQAEETECKHEASVSEASCSSEAPVSETAQDWDADLATKDQSDEKDASEMWIVVSSE